jgi:hypothetical protein
MAGRNLCGLRIGSRPGVSSLRDTFWGSGLSVQFRELFCVFRLSECPFSPRRPPGPLNTACFLGIRHARASNEHGFPDGESSVLDPREGMYVYVYGHTSGASTCPPLAANSSRFTLDISANLRNSKVACGIRQEEGHRRNAPERVRSAHAAPAECQNGARCIAISQQIAGVPSVGKDGLTLY